MISHVVRYSKRQACNLIGGSRVPGEFFFVIVVVKPVYKLSRFAIPGERPWLAIGGNENVRFTWRAVIRSVV